MTTYEREAAALVLSRLGACQGVTTTYVERCDGSSIGTDREIRSDYPQWYRYAVNEQGMEGGKIRDALACVADGREPNAKQKEARWIVETLARARTHGDATLSLHPENRGGGARGVTQAEHRPIDGPVARFPLRIAACDLARLREQAAHRGVTLNAYLCSILSDVASPAGDP